MSDVERTEFKLPDELAAQAAAASAAGIPATNRNADVDASEQPGEQYENAHEPSPASGNEAAS